MHPLLRRPAAQPRRRLYPRAEVRQPVTAYGSQQPQWHLLESTGRPWAVGRCGWGYTEDAVVVVSIGELQCRRGIRHGKGGEGPSMNEHEIRYVLREGFAVAMRTEQGIKVITLIP